MAAFARGLALADEKEQADFLNEFAQELVSACKARWSDQVFYMARGLSLQALDVLRELVKATEFEQEQARVNASKLSDVRHELWELERKRDALAKEVGGF